jgi:hypothetical protein
MKIPGAKAGGGAIFCLRVWGLIGGLVGEGPLGRTRGLGLGVGWDFRWVARVLGTPEAKTGGR